MNYRELSKLKNSSAEELIQKIEETKPNISELAREAGISRNTIYKIKKGSVPNLSTINKLKKILKEHEFSRGYIVKI